MALRHREGTNCPGRRSFDRRFAVHSVLFGVSRATGIRCALWRCVIIAIPTWQGRVSPVLDSASRLLLVSWQKGKEVERRECILSSLPGEALAANLAELRIDLVLCAALSEPLLRALRQRGVRVRSHLCGDLPDILEAFRCRRLGQPEFRMPGCWGLHTRSGVCLPPRAHALARSRSGPQPVPA